MNAQKCPDPTQFREVVRYVARELQRIIAETKGNCVAVKPSDVWCDRVPAYLSLTGYILKRLAEAKYVELVRKYRVDHGYVYIYRICRTSPLWKAAQAGPEAFYDAIISIVDSS